jgi:hypothetical protein
MQQGVFKYRKALLQTVALSLLIPIIWGWMFRSTYSSETSLREALRYDSWAEGFYRWLTSLNVGPWLLAVCLATPIPLVVAGKGKRSYAPTFIAVLFLLLSMWVTDFWNDGNSLNSWFGWAGLYRLTFLLMPMAAAFLGCIAIPAGYNLLSACRKPHPDQESGKGSLADFALILAIVLGNLVCVFAAILAVAKLKADGVGPFFNGFWEGSAVLLPAPNWLHRFLASSAGKCFVVSWGVLIGLMGFMAWLRTRKLLDAGRALLVGFVVSGFVALWVAGDVVFNYPDLLGRLLASRSPA